MAMLVGMRMPVIVPVDVIGDVPVRSDVIVAMTYPGTADVMVMPLLQRTDGIVVPDDARAVFAKLAVHRRSAGFAFVDAIEKGLDDLRMVAQIAGLDERDLREAGGGGIGLGVDAFDQDAGEQEIRETRRYGGSRAAPRGRAPPRPADARPR